MTFFALNYNVSIEHSIGANYQYSYFGEFYNARAITLNYAYKLSDFSSISISAAVLDCARTDSISQFLLFTFNILASILIPLS